MLLFCDQEYYLHLAISPSFIYNLCFEGFYIISNMKSYITVIDLPTNHESNDYVEYERNRLHQAIVWSYFDLTW